MEKETVKSEQISQLTKNSCVCGSHAPFPKLAIKTKHKPSIVSLSSSDSREMKGCLTISVPLSKGWNIGKVRNNHHSTHKLDGVALHSKANWEPLEQGDLKLTGMDLSQMGHWTGTQK